MKLKPPVAAPGSWGGLLEAFKAVEGGFVLVWFVLWNQNQGTFQKILLVKGKMPKPKTCGPYRDALLPEPLSHFCCSPFGEAELGLAFQMMGMKSGAPLAGA